MLRITYRVRNNIIEDTSSNNVINNTTSKLYPSNRFNKSKKFIYLTSIALLSVPAKSLTTSDNTVSTFDNVMLNDALTIASVKGDSTFFSSDGFEHGFGYDITRNLANHLDVNLILKEYPTNEAALNAVKLGEVDMALSVASPKLNTENNTASMNLSCGRDSTLTKNGLNPKVNWSFSDSQDRLAVTASHFICNNQQMLKTAKVANFYNQNLLKDAYNQKHFEQALSEKLPSYKSSFKTQANTFNHDWELLVAMGYQESHLNANAVSPTGVEGIMMLTNSTAEAMGVSNRIDPTQSIQGGAKYLELMKEQFEDVPYPDKTWFALASYNMGPNAVKNIQRKLELIGKDPNSWSNVYAYMSDNTASNRRYVQCMHYVKNIRSYLESLKTQV